MQDVSNQKKMKEMLLTRVRSKISQCDKYQD